MNSIYVDPPFDGARTVGELYAGEVVVRLPSPTTLRLVGHVRDAIADAFPALDPLTAQHELTVGEFVGRCARLKAACADDPRVLECIRAIVEEHNFDRDDTYLGPPQVRVATSDGYLAAHADRAHHHHRDTWYAASMAQIDWWMPVYDYGASAGMAFHPNFWSQPVGAVSPLDAGPEVRVVTRAGSLVIFSAAHLHSTSTNRSGVSRWSVDFSTVNLRDVIGGRGAPNLDSSASGTALRDFVRLRDFMPFPAQFVGSDGDPADLDVRPREMFT